MKPKAGMGARANDRARWALGVAVLASVLAVFVWLVVTDAPIVRFTIRLYRDNVFLKETVAAWGWAAPLIFVGIQALQVILSPIPGEITGPVGGALFGTFWGVVYSTVGLTLGTLVCFALGRLYGEPLVRPWLSERHWNRMHFILEAEGAILCFILYLIPGFPKDIISYLFGLSPIPFWIFAIVSTLGRLPGTWVSSYVGAHVAEHQFIYVFLLLAIVAAVSMPLFYYRRPITAFFQRLGDHRSGKGLDRGPR
jgi:uncharacterized membrane protein YdjX (TVP38/TMEM64 family)